jgi:hypothetical protein
MSTQDTTVLDGNRNKLSLIFVKKLMEEKPMNYCQKAMVTADFRQSWSSLLAGSPSLTASRPQTVKNIR